MSLHDDVELACENAEDGLCTVSPDGFGEVGVPVSTLRSILARYPESASATEDEREGVMRVVLGVDAWPAMGVHDGTPTLTEAGKVVDAILAAGYRKRPEVTVEDVARAAAKVLAGYHSSDEREEYETEAMDVATAVLALINGEES